MATSSPTKLPPLTSPSSPTSMRDHAQSHGTSSFATSTSHSTALVPATQGDSNRGRSASAAETALRIDHKTKRFGSVRTVRMAYALPCGLSTVFIMIATAICGLWASSLLSLNDFAVQQSTAATISLAQMVDTSISANIQARLYNGTYGVEFMVNSNVTCTVCPDPIIPSTEKWYYHIDSTTGRPISPAYNKRTYNFRTRGWYRNATLANATYWTDLYAYSSGALSGISLCEPQYTTPRQNGSPNGVVTMDVSLQPLIKFLKDAMNNAVGTAYLMDAKGRLLASSTGEPVLVNNLQISASSSSDAFTRETNKRIQPLIADNSTTSKIIRDSDYWFSFRTMDAGGATGLVIVAGKPTSTYTGPIQIMQMAFSDSLNISVRNAALVTTAFLVAIAALAIHLTHRMVIAPLKQMRLAIMKASELDFKHVTVNDTMIPSRFDELNALQYAFRTMCASFATGIMQTRQLVKASVASEQGSTKHGGASSAQQTQTGTSGEGTGSRA
ncbi:hypothetical protein BCR44DRAFT_70851 [Catenaria anguillulae PL171]|uniref:HAMP domain-containing protein n=1 Tax=Catenaria anguillulae PL171 TaxID=765915 RepID=A0A1Y2HMN2_9FUNG|nr:hypothetical protein BCR44DRAFT_70851 [Catenaria anguillulae PL171]